MTAKTPGQVLYDDQVRFCETKDLVSFTPKAERRTSATVECADVPHMTAAPPPLLPAERSESRRFR